MKRFLALALLFSLIFSCCFTVDAAIIYRDNNIDESTALPVNFGDTIIIDGQIPDGGVYYKIDVPYTGVVTCNVKTQKTGGESYIVQTDFNMRFDVFKSRQILRWNGGTTVKYKTVYPGTYYFVVSPRDGNFGYFRYTFEFDFECSHVDKEVVIASEPTCTSVGERQEICSECKEVISSEEIDKIPHTPAKEWTITKEVSCAADGEKTLYCAVCEQTIETEVIEALPHTYGEWNIDKETSCSSPGRRSRVCEDCKHEDEEEIEQLDHTFGKWIVEVEATCADEGKRSRACTVCGYEEKENTDTVPHEYGSWETVEDSTCASEGERKRTCKDCGEVEYEKIELKAHKYGQWVTVTKETETNTGKKERKCTNCDHKETETIPKLIHGEEFDWVVTKEPTCTSNGTKIQVCAYCDRTMSTKSIPATAHSFSKWYVAVEPTSTGKGTEKRVCELCNKEETRSLSLEHGEQGSWVVKTEPTCKKDGERAFFCACCNKEMKTEKIDKLPHNFGNWSTTEKAYPEKHGSQERVCSSCGEKEKEEVKYDFSERKKKERGAHPFNDVSKDQWYESVVADCYHYGLMIGNSEITFNPKGNMTVAEAITAGVRIYCLYNPDEEKPSKTETPWYKGYVDYAIEKGIIKEGDFADYTVPVTRAQMAYIFTNCAKDELEKINNYEALPDVGENHKYAKEIFALYNAGILNGNDEYGTFMPEKEINRAEVAAIIARISRISERKKK